ncbi:MAG: hypothetical protein AUI04_07905 [Candidatus Rokubacteria bacterium 13_2_20CM_2_64_8]|nr:MAG: hypothetical protein AUI04_07905 [Candidatus Rokubacteria bacterium 13_2_20CM_2_64_8]
MKFVATSGTRVETVEVTEEGGRYRVQVGERVWEIDARLASPGIYSLLVDGVSYVATVAEHDGSCLVDVGGETHAVRVEEHTRYVIRTRGGAGAGGDGHRVAAPLPGRVTHIAVRPGDRVQVGDTLLVIEAMKMENEFRASAAGTVAEVRVEPGQAVNAGDVLIVIAS